MKNCVGTISLEKPKGVLINYSATSAGPWSTSITGAYWIRFSSNNGATWSAARKFVGTDGTDGQDINNYSLLLNYLGAGGGDKIDINSNSVEFNTSYNLVGNSIINDGDYIKITAIIELPTSGSNDNDARLYIMLGNYPNHDSEMAFIDINGTIDATTNTVKLVTTINKAGNSTTFIEYSAMRNGQPGVMEDSPMFKIVNNTFNFGTDNLITVKGTDNSGGAAPLSNIYLRQLKVELFNLTV